MSKSTSQARAQAAFLAGQQQSAAQATAQAQSQIPSVSVHGNVRNSVVPWTEDLTLAKAIVAAVYQGRNNPKMIYVIRNGQTTEVAPRELLGGNDMPLQAGDVVEIIP